MHFFYFGGIDQWHGVGEHLKKRILLLDRMSANGLKDLMRSASRLIGRKEENMKRVIACFTVILLLFQGTACERAKEDPPIPTQTDADLPSVAVPFLGWQTACDFLGTDGIVDVSERAYSYSNMVADLRELSETYPDRFSVESIGTSVAGRTLYLGILGNRNAARQVIVTAAIHAREYLTALLTMKQIEFYLQYYDTGYYNNIPYSELFHSCCFYIVPMCNPDGVMLSQEGISSVSDDRLQETIVQIHQADLRDGFTNRMDLDSFLQYWKANAAGTDLNRNFDALWEEYKNIDRPCCARYRGPYAESEPETCALVALTKRLPNVRAVLCMHSQGEVLYWNCGQDETLKAKTLKFAHAVSARTGYRILSQQHNDASYSDWCALQQGLIAVTVETGSGVCPLEIEQFSQMWEDHYDLLPLTAAYFYS